MAKFVIEGTELNFEEKVILEDEKQTLKPTELVVERLEKTIIKSPIYTFADNTSVLIKKNKRFGEDYYKIIIYSSGQDKAWGISDISAKLDVTLKRLDDSNVLVIGENKSDEKLISQITFCKLKPSMNVEEVTINFTQLEILKFIKDKAILVGVKEMDYTQNINLNVLSLYSYEGKLIKNFYEFYDNDEITYSANIGEEEVVIEIVDKSGKKKQEKFEFEKLLTEN